MNKLLKSLILSFVISAFLGTSLPTIFVSSSDTLSIGVEKAWAKQNKKQKKKKAQKKKKQKKGAQQPPLCLPPGCTPGGGGDI